MPHENSSFIENFTRKAMQKFIHGFLHHWTWLFKAFVSPIFKSAAFGVINYEINWNSTSNQSFNLALIHFAASKNFAIHYSSYHLEIHLPNPLHVFWPTNYKFKIDLHFNLTDSRPMASQLFGFP